MAATVYKEYRTSTPTDTLFEMRKQTETDTFAYDSQLINHRQT